MSVNQPTTNTRIVLKTDGHIRYEVQIKKKFLLFTFWTYSKSFFIEFGEERAKREARAFQEEIEKAMS